MYYLKSPIWILNFIFYWKFDQLLVEKLKNQFWLIFSYFDTRFPTPNMKPFIHLLIFTPNFCSYLSLLTFYDIFFLFGCCHYIPTVLALVRGKFPGFCKRLTFLKSGFATFSNSASCQNWPVLSESDQRSMMMMTSTTIKSILTLMLPSTF